jgi:hypothetical protein
MNDKEFRTKKVYYSYNNALNGIPHPTILLSGIYLERHGFNIGDQIEIHLEKNQIVITKPLEPFPSVS